MSRGLEQRAFDLFDEICDLPPAERRTLLESRCASDPEVRALVETMLENDDSADEGSDPLSGGGAELVAREVFSGEDTAAPERIGRYRVIREIGRGGMGVVFEAEQDEPRRRVALKVIRDSFASPEMRRRFRNEAGYLARLQHPGIAHVYEVGEARHGPSRWQFFAMELIEGLPIDEHVEQNGLDARQVLELAARVCDAVQHAHQRGLLHRDLKPANVLVSLPREPATGHGESAIIDPIGQPKILDFGVARLESEGATESRAQTRVGQVIGTVGYMSPEQRSGDPELVDTRSDVYAIGVLLYALLAGRVPSGESFARLRRETGRTAHDEPERLASIDRRLRGDVETIIAKAVESDADRRYASAAALGDDLRRCLRDEAILARPATTMYQLRKLAHRHRPAVIGGVVAIALLVAGVISTSWFAVAASNNRDRAISAARVADEAAYLGRIAAASAALRELDVPTARRHLDAAPVALRGWEWRMLEAELDASIGIAQRTPISTELMLATRHLRHDAWLSGSALCVARFRANGVQLSVECIDLETMTPSQPWTVRHGRYLGHSSDGATVLVLRPDGSSARVDSRSGRLVAGAGSGDGNDPADASDRAEFDLAARVASEHEGGRAVVSPSGEWLAVTQESMLEVRSLDGLRRFDLGPHRESVSSVAFSPGERFIATATYARRIAVFDLQREGAPVWIMEDAHTDAATAVAFSPDGATLVSGGQDRVLRFWDAATGESRGIALGHAHTANAIVWPPNGAGLLTVDAATVRVWDPSLDQSTLTSDLTTEGPRRVMCVTRDGLLISARGSLKVWDARSGALVVEEMVGGVGLGFVAIAADDRSLAFLYKSAESAEQRVRVMDLRTGRSVADAPLPEGVRLDAISFTADGERVVFPGGSAAYLDSATLRVVERGAAAREIRLHRPTGRLGISSGEGLRVLDRRGVELRQWRTGETLGPERIARAHAWCFDAAGDGVLWANDDGTILHLDIESGAVLREFRGHSEAVRWIEPMPDGSRFLSGGEDGVVRVWDPLITEPVCEMRDHLDAVTSIAVTPDGASVFTASNDLTIRRYTTRSRAERARERRAWHEATERLQPLVDELLATHGDAAVVADRLATMPDLDERERQIAHQCLLGRVIAAAW